MSTKEILSIENLTLSIESEAGLLHPLRKLNLSMDEGELLVILGESGAGKSLLLKTLMGLLPAHITRAEGSLRSHWGPESMSLILQDPKKLLDPSMTIGRQVMESLKYAGVPRKERKERAMLLLKEVAMDPPDLRFTQYVHELSGGLAQRAVIAVALAKSPRILLADEPTTALDAEHESKIIGLLKELTRKNHMTTLLITHSLKVAKEAGDRIAVMYAGRIVEVGLPQEVLQTPVHPYTQALVRSASLLPDPDGYLSTIAGLPPCPGTKYQGDPFAERNPEALVIDFLEEPPLRSITETHFAATWLLDERYQQEKGSGRRPSS